MVASNRTIFGILEIIKNNSKIIKPLYKKPYFEVGRIEDNDVYVFIPTKYTILSNKDAKKIKDLFGAIEVLLIDNEDYRILSIKLK